MSHTPQIVFEPFSDFKQSKIPRYQLETFFLNIYTELCAQPNAKFSSLRECCRVREIFRLFPSSTSCNLMTHEKNKKKYSKTHESHSRYSSCFNFWQDPIFYELIRIFSDSSSSSWPLPSLSRRPKQYVPFSRRVHVLGEGEKRDDERQTRDRKEKRSKRKKKSRETWLEFYVVCN